MKTRTFLPVASLLSAILILPNGALAQKRPGNTNQSRATTLRSFIAGGSGNLIPSNTITAFIGGGEENTADRQAATIGGGLLNTNSGFAATISGGKRNTVSGGFGSPSSGDYATIGGGEENTAKTNYATIGGGLLNTNSGYASTIAGGEANTVSDELATIGGGYGNTNSGIGATIGGGQRNTASGYGSTIGGGADNTAKTNYATIGGGSQNTNSGLYATVPGGYLNEAGGEDSFAAGARARATNAGAFVWSVNAAPTVSTNANSFTVRAPGGARFLTTTATNALVGVILTNNATSWSSLSDSNSKTDFESIKPREILSKVADLPVTAWHYKHDPRRRYIGPMAQDFRAAFGLGSDDKTISTLDSDGVMYAAIQGLVEELKERDKAMAARDRTIEELKAMNDELSRNIEAINQRLDSLPPAP